MQPEDEDAILREVVIGKTVREVARARGLTVPEVNRVLDLAAARRFSGEGMRRALLRETERLEILTQQLWDQAVRDHDLHAAVHQSERKVGELDRDEPPVGPQRDGELDAGAGRAGVEHPADARGDPAVAWRGAGGERQRRK